MKTETKSAPDFSAYVRDDRMVVQIKLTTGWTSVAPPSDSTSAIKLAGDVLASGQDLHMLRIVGVEFAS
jgi:hypothetical protein